jgi:virginiamycin A acetyltransferase
MSVAREYLKRIVAYLVYITISPIILVAKGEEFLTGEEDIFYFFANLLSLIPGRIGKYIRTGYYHGTLISCPWDADIGFGSFFSHRKAMIGTNVHIGAFCIIGQVLIENNVMLASRVSVLSGDKPHAAEDGRMTSSVFKPVTVKIGEGSWVGEGAIIMKDVSKNCIIAAGCVVTKSIPDNCTGIGNPVKYFRM